MLQKTRGIALNFIKYKETSIISRIYTEEYGLQSYLVNGVRSSKKKRSAGKIAFFQPFSLLEMVVYYKKDANLKRISELKCSHQLHHIPGDIRKSSVVLFLTEALIRILKEDDPDQKLFKFLTESIIFLEHSKKDFENFHLQFLLKASQFLGFGPSSGKELQFELKSQNIKVVEFRDEIIDRLLADDFGVYLKMTNNERSHLLDAIVNMFRLHFDNLGELRSMQVLRAVMH